MEIKTQNGTTVKVENHLTPRRGEIKIECTYYIDGQKVSKEIAEAEINFLRK